MRLAVGRFHAPRTTHHAPIFPRSRSRSSFPLFHVPAYAKASAGKPRITPRGLETTEDAEVFTEDTKVRRQKPVASMQIARSSRLLFLGHGLVPCSLFSTSLVARPSYLTPVPRTPFRRSSIRFTIFEL